MSASPSKVQPTGRTSAAAQAPPWVPNTLMERGGERSAGGQRTGHVLVRVLLQHGAQEAQLGVQQDLSRQRQRAQAPDRGCQRQQRARRVRHRGNRRVEQDAQPVARVLVPLIALRARQVPTSESCASTAGESSPGATRQPRTPPPCPLGAIFDVGPRCLVVLCCCVPAGSRLPAPCHNSRTGVTARQRTTTTLGRTRTTLCGNLVPSLQQRLQQFLVSAAAREWLPRIRHPHKASQPRRKPGAARPL